LLQTADPGLPSWAGLRPFLRELALGPNDDLQDKTFIFIIFYFPKHLFSTNPYNIGIAKDNYLFEFYD
jgi:hypothetical protein